MDDSGKIHDLTTRGVSIQEAKAKGLTEIPRELVTSVRWLTRPQRRAWKALVSAGSDPKDALAMVQS
jgi:hypothetical protein